MNNSIELRGSQVMINEIVKNKTKFLSILKWLLCLLALGFLIHFPDVIAHGIMWMVHTFYETISFLLEEFLRHTFGFDKFLAQLIVFYLSVVVVIVATVLLWRQVIRMLLNLRDYLIIKLSDYKHQVIYYWHSNRIDRKIKFILIYSALMISAFMFLLN